MSESAISVSAEIAKPFELHDLAFKGGRQRGFQQAVRQHLHRRRIDVSHHVAVRTRIRREQLS